VQMWESMVIEHVGPVVPVFGGSTRLEHRIC